MFECNVCGEKFNDLFTHLSGKEQGFLTFQDEQHQAYYALIMNTRKGVIYTKDCFCGGAIVTTGHGSPDGDASWESSCTKCGNLYDED